MDKPNVVSLELQMLVSSTLARSVIVQTLFHKEPVDIKDLDETTTAEEIAQAITSVTGPRNVDRYEYQTPGILQWHSSSQCPVASCSNKEADEST